MLHHLKIKEEFADAIVRGEKTFEIRINDRGFQKGDLIEFVTVQEDLPFPDCHPIHNRTYEITYVMNGWGLKNGYVVFGNIPDNGETFIEMFEQENDGWWTDVWEYPVYDYTAWQKKIVSVFKEHIQPVIRKMVKAESEDKE